MFGSVKTALKEKRDNAGDGGQSNGGRVDVWTSGRVDVLLCSTTKQQKTNSDKKDTVTKKTIKKKE